VVNKQLHDFRATIFSRHDQGRRRRDRTAFKEQPHGICVPIGCSLHEQREPISVLVVDLGATSQTLLHIRQVSRVRAEARRPTCSNQAQARHHEAECQGVHRLRSHADVLTTSPLSRVEKKNTVHERQMSTFFDAHRN
jgi:hypothetical protein